MQEEVWTVSAGRICAADGIELDVARAAGRHDGGRRRGRPHLGVGQRRHRSMIRAGWRQAEPRRPVRLELAGIDGLEADGRRWTRSSEWAR